MAIIKAGTYVANDNAEQVVTSFPVTNTLFSSGEYALIFNNGDATYAKISRFGTSMAYVDSADKSTSVISASSGSTTWQNTEYQTIVVETDQTVDDTFGTWFNENYIEQKATPTVTFDLTTLDLPEGTHTISVIGKADGYKASAASESVSYTVEPSTVTIPSGTYVANTTLNSYLENGYMQNITFTLPLLEGALTQRAMSFSLVSGKMWLNYCYGGNAQYATQVYNFTDLTWTATTYKKIVISTEQEVTLEYGDWFNANFTKQ